MAKATPIQVVRSSVFIADVADIYDYGLDTFGQHVADTLLTDIYQSIALLPQTYLIHPICRHIPTKTNIYRNIVLGKYLIIYRITSKRIEVLRAIHGSIAPATITRVRKVKI